ncbi:hypothetical protein KXD97_05875 [Mycobacterium sp. SMC-8]|uniref:hypothetical protein n=1 Tax=Mycobacterium sp. SMC-8 TaxID=2857060 RepID=UPI0021B4B0C4|nr:hypothetical protein [Mycobacterium sp. SMC-8]UXA13351.1 hypothetical protein KXD97_05875 [Mycobacterium sp. SMC-8]
MGGGARVAAAACLVISGLLVGGGATASADTRTPAEDVADSPARPETLGGAADGRDPDGAKPGDDAGDGQEGEPDLDPDSSPDAEGKDDGGDSTESPPVSDEPGAEDDGALSPRPPCCEGADKDCEPGWPWPWPPWPWSDIPDDGPGSDNDYGEGPPQGVPSIRPVPGGVMRPGVEPPVGEPEHPDVLDVVPDVGVAAGDLPEAPVSVPILITVPAVGGAPGPAAAGSGPATSAGPRRFAEKPPPRQQTTTTTVGADLTVPASANRVGYGDYLRGAGISQIAALALPGLAGLLVLTGAGGLVGYRQARAGQGVRTAATARFMN